MFRLRGGVVMMCRQSRRFTSQQGIESSLSLSPIPISKEDQNRFFQDGFLAVENVLTKAEVEAVRNEFEGMFAGHFDTGIYPDEWHWRKGLSYPNKTREIVNAWKSSTIIQRVVLSPRLGQFASTLMGWVGCRIAQDDILWKPAGAQGVAYHRDGAYISDNFTPVENNSITVWIALDDANQETGVVEYARGSHKWPSDIVDIHSSDFHGANDDHKTPLLRAAKAAKVNTDSIDIVQLSVRAGSAIVHHQNVWHGSGANNSRNGRERRALGIHLLRSDVQFIPNPKYIYGRYKLRDSTTLDEAFFPTMWKRS